MSKTIKVKKQNGDEEVEEEEVDTHKGGLFFPLPNGTALLYRLVGTANAPDAENEIQETVTAKKAKSIIIPVKNWSKQSQRFNASWKVEATLIQLSSSEEPKRSMLAEAPPRSTNSISSVLGVVAIDSR